MEHTNEHIPLLLLLTNIYVCKCNIALCDNLLYQNKPNFIKEDVKLSKSINIIKYVFENLWIQ